MSRGVQAGDCNVKANAVGQVVNLRPGSWDSSQVSNLRHKILSHCFDARSEESWREHFPGAFAALVLVHGPVRASHQIFDRVSCGPITPRQAATDLSTT